VVLRQAELRVAGLFVQEAKTTPASQVDATQFNLHTPVGGALWNEALAGGCANTDTTCIRNYIFKNPTAPGVTRAG
jgi:hypothetical protein